MDTRADIELFIFLIKQEEKNDMQYKFIAKTELLISTSKKESSNKLVWSGLLDKGVYVLIPSTTGCIFTKRKIQPSSDIHLTEIDDLTGDTILTSKYCQTIEQIFYQLDLDEKSCLSRAEFNLYNWRTSGLELNVIIVNFFLFFCLLSTFTPNNFKVYAQQKVPEKCFSYIFGIRKPK